MSVASSEKIVSVDAANTVRVYGGKPLALTDGFRIGITEEESFVKSKAVSADGLLIAISAKKRGVIVYSVPAQKARYQFRRHDGEVESLAFAPSVNYLATGGQDGKTFLWHLQSGRMIASLKHHRDYVTSIAFSGNGNWIATGGYDRSVQVSNLSSLTFSHALNGHLSAVTALCFVSSGLLASGEKNGDIILWDFMRGRVTVRLKKMLDEVRCMCVTEDGRFLFAAARDGMVSLYDLFSSEQIAMRYFKFPASVNTMAYHNSSDETLLVIGNDEGELIVYDLVRERELLHETIASGQIADAYEMVLANPMLRYTPAYGRLEQLWERSVTAAEDLMKQGKKKEAAEVLQPYMGESEKRLLVQQLLNDFEHHDKFKNAVIGRKFTLAYSVAGQYPMLKKTKEFTQMEAEWQETFAQAKTLLLRGSMEERAKKLFAPFRGVSEKSAAIQSLFREKELYKLFEKLVAKTEYQKALDLAGRYPAIKTLDDYGKIEQMAKKIERDATRALEAGDYATAARLAQELKSFGSKEEIAEEIIEKANMYATVLNLFAEKAYARLYKMIDKYPYLESTKVARQLEEAWQKVVTAAENAAASGDVRETKRALGAFFAIESKRGKIRSLFQATYTAQMEKAVAAKKTNAARLQETLKRTIALVGYSDLFEPLMAQCKMEKPQAIADADTVNFAALPEAVLE